MIRIIFKTGLLFFICILILSLRPVNLIAQDERDSSGESEAAEEIKLSDEELATILQKVDGFYYNQSIARADVDVDIYRDPSNRLNDKNIREGNPGSIAGLSTMVSHFIYQWPDFYSLTIMGEVLAGSKVPADSTFFSCVLPLPGAPIFTDEIRKRFRISYEGTEEINGIGAYKIRYSAIDRDKEFFDYVTYYIDIDRNVLLRVESSFDNVFYSGSGEGDFYYRNMHGKYLPEYGHGNVLFYPNRRFNIWAKWYKWDTKTPEELEKMGSGEGR